MFTTGQLIFAALFVLVFLGILIFSYRKDKKLHHKNYKGVVWILLAFIVFLLFLLATKSFLKN